MDQELTAIKEMAHAQQALIEAQRRGKILAFEAALAQLPGAVFGDTDLCPLTHHFGDGIYMREILIPQGCLVVGKIHRHAHPVFLVRGALILMTAAGGVEEVRAPLAFMAPAGVKRAALALEETVWITVHANPTDTRDLAAIEAAVIAPSFAAYDASKMPEAFDKQRHIGSSRGNWLIRSAGGDVLCHS